MTGCRSRYGKKDHSYLRNSSGSLKHVSTILRAEPARPSFGQLYGLHNTADSLDLERLLQRGARFVTKPLSSGELLRAIRDVRAAHAPAPEQET